MIEQDRIFSSASHLDELSGIDHWVSPQSILNEINSGSRVGFVALFPEFCSPPLLFSSGNGRRSTVIDEGDINIQNGALWIS